ncbi:polyisoprenoid-binding protein [Methylopila jiangsuensis]|uniref:Polyisoprenoid-binding protein n=1 Tax=Methylopila jiangsuensis TaxID=586230 RepID=A0A9W6JD47_9HYPH|nr:YceI family protein [Methylopila jiangsuensis]MDR6285321.1 polyisoprenoid-binding protein YceI [Methylopila jiangsuensis]GLK75077.1 polyisoprenoid-binding protein [Methylopila jiangsuensis]
MKRLSLALAAALLVAAPAASYAAEGLPGAKEAARVTAGTYKVDPNHTQVVWSVDHMGFTPLYGAFGQPTGSLTFDPKAPSEAKLSVEFPISGLTVTSDKFSAHLKGDEFFDAAKFPKATFVSTKVEASGETAWITGDLTVHGVTKPVTLEASFFGAGQNPMSKAETIGFTATAKVKRSEFGLGAFVPAVADEVDLKIVGAFEK